jgi:peroxiredoxin
MIMLQRRISIALLCLAACTADPPPTKPAVQITETPSEKLGTTPPGVGLAIGEKAPDASLVSVTGTTESLAAMYARAPTVVLFYRGGWCPFCNLQLHEYAAAKSEFDARGVQIVAISVDQPFEEAKTQAKHGIPFAMLSDSKLVAHRAYRVVHVPGEPEKTALAHYHVDLAAYSGETHGDFAVPATIVVDRAGVVRFMHADEEYKTRPSAKQILAVLDRLALAK